MSTSQGTYGQIEQMSYVIRGTRNMQHGGGAGGVRLGNAAIRQEVGPV